MKKQKAFFAIVGLVSTIGLVTVFIFQKTDVAGFLEVGRTSIDKFVVNRIIRFFLNDIFAIGLICALFREKKYLIFAVWVQLVGVILFLIPYFMIRIYFPFYDGPLISYLHRLVINPILLILLIPAFYYQRSLVSNVS